MDHDLSDDIFIAAVDIHGRDVIAWPNDVTFHEVETADDVKRLVEAQGVFLNRFTACDGCGTLSDEESEPPATTT